MAPNDPMFEPDDGTPANEPEGQPAPTVSADQLEAALSSLTAPLEAERDNQRHVIDTMNQQIQGLQAQLSQQAPAPATDTDFNDELYSDPKGTIQKVAQEMTDQRITQLGPALQNLVQLGRTAVYDRYMQDVDKEFGEGTWDDHFSGIINQRLSDEQQSNPMAGANVDWMNREVMAVKGLKMSELLERQEQKIAKTEEDRAAEEKRIVDNFVNTTTMHGGVNMRPENRPSGPTDPEKGFMDELKRAGIDMSLEDLRRNADCGTTLSEWRAAKKAAEEK